MPITLMAVGGGVLLNAGAFALVAAASCSNSLGGGCEDEHLYIMGGIAGVGGIVAVIGLTMLLDRISERRELGRLIRRIEQEPGASRSHLQLQPRLAGRSLLSWSL